MGLTKLIDPGPASSQWTAIPGIAAADAGLQFAGFGAKRAAGK
jgi:hypothetical protein